MWTRNDGIAIRALLDSAERIGFVAFEFRVPSDANAERDGFVLIGRALHWSPRPEAVRYLGEAREADGTRWGLYSIRGGYRITRADGCTIWAPNASPFVEPPA